MDRINQAFHIVPRTAFLPMDVRERAELDRPLPIGFGQTNSQPSTVRLMLEWLGPQSGEKILDIGSGSGWTTALLAYLVGSKGSIYAVEKIPQLVSFGRKNCEQAGARNVRFFEAGSTYGLPDFAPYDRILVSAAALTLPKALLEQLKVGGRLVIPIGNSIHVIDKINKSTHRGTENPGFLFVPLIE